MNTEIAICIPTFNQAAYLGQAVTSGLGQKNVDCEIWVGDDASTDETPRVAGRFAAEPRVHYHRQTRNLGIAGNNNSLLRRPQTEFIVRLDSDDVLGPDYAAALVAELKRFPCAGYAHAAVREIDRVGTVTRERTLARKPGFETHEDSLRAMTVGYRVAANICMFRRRALLDVGFYRPDLNFAEDWDMAVRLADAGWGNVYCGRVLADYRVWSDAKNLRARRKLAEIDGCRRVFTDSIEPAYRRRKWPVGPLNRRRQTLAAQHALGVSAAVFDATEKAALVLALRALGDGPPLRRRLALLRMGFGGALARKEAALLWAKDTTKRLLRG